MGETLSDDGFAVQWERLPHAIKREVAGFVHPNEVAENVKLIDRDTAAALRNNYNTLILGYEHVIGETHRAVQPWPARAFVDHWGRPEPWRGLSLHMRRRLLCLAASSGHADSLDVALQHCGCGLQEEVLTSAAASGSVAACERLLQEGCSISCRHSAFIVAAENDHLPVLQLLLETVAGSHDMQGCLTAAATGACMQGHGHILAWLQRAHGYRLASKDVRAAATGGNVDLMEQLLQQWLEESESQAEAAEAEAGAAAGDVAAGVAAGGLGVADTPGAARALQKELPRLLKAIARGCPVEVLQRYCDMLDTPWGSWWPEQLQPAWASEEEEEEAEEACAMFEISVARDILAAAADSGTPCWAAKMDFLLSRWGPRLVREALHGEWLSETDDYDSCFEDAGVSQPDYALRLRHMHAIGIPLDNNITLDCARGNADALAYLVECGVYDPSADVVHVPHSSISCGGIDGLIGVLQLMHERGMAITPKMLAQATYYRSWPDKALLWFEAHAGDPGEDMQQWWSKVFWRAARDGASLLVLQKLRARGAAIDLAAVAVGGSEEGLEWAAAQLEAEMGGGVLQQVRMYMCVWAVRTDLLQQGMKGCIHGGGNWLVCLAGRMDGHLAPQLASAN